MAERSGAALSSAEKALSSLETSISKARMEAAAQRAKADDLVARLDSLRAATKVSSALLLCTDLHGWLLSSSCKAGRPRHQPAVIQRSP